MIGYIAPFSHSISWGSSLIAFVLTATMLSPLLFWLYNGWASKREEIFASLSTSAKNKYLRAFSNQIDDITTAEDRFKKFYNKWYGRRNYIMPMVLLTLITLYETFSLGDTAQFYLYQNQVPVITDAYYKLPEIAAAALSGAYIFVTYDLISRASQRDLTSHDVAANALRLAGCIPVGYALAGLAAPAIGTIIAFAVGVFPLNTVSTILRRVAAKQLGLENETAIKSEKVVQLSGVDEQIAERLFEADISTIAQLAYSDPIQLTMRSNLEFDFVVDIVSEALAWIYLGVDLDKIRPMGLRGAIEISILKKEATAAAGLPFQKTSAAVVDEVAKALNLEPACARNVIHEIADDSTTEFLTEVYNRGNLDAMVSTGGDW